MTVGWVAGSFRPLRRGANPLILPSPPKRRKPAVFVGDQGTGSAPGPGKREPFARSSVSVSRPGGREPLDRSTETPASPSTTTQPTATSILDQSLTRCPPAATDRVAVSTVAAEVDGDAELMARTAAGDRQAFAELVDRHKDALITYLTRLCGDRPRAEDLAQESFIRLFQAAASYRDRGSFRGYLFRIGTNLLRSEQRREQRWRWLQPMLRPMLRLASEDGVMVPQRRVLADEAQRQVAGALASLPLNFRAPLVLFEIEGWSYQRIAELLGCREGTVKSRIHRGREQLRRRLAGYWKGETT